MYFVVDYFKWGELNRWYFSPRVGSEGGSWAGNISGAFKNLIVWLFKLHVRALKNKEEQIKI
jgi:hypothetical protein